MRNPFAYGFLPFMVYVHQDGRKFYVTLGRTHVALGLTATTRPILWARYPGRGSGRQTLTQAGVEAATQQEQGFRHPIP